MFYSSISLILPGTISSGAGLRRGANQNVCCTCLMRHLLGAAGSAQVINRPSRCRILPTNLPASFFFVVFLCCVSDQLRQQTSHGRVCTTCWFLPHLWADRGGLPWLPCWPGKANCSCAWLVCVHHWRVKDGLNAEVKPTTTNWCVCKYFGFLPHLGVIMGAAEQVPAGRRTAFKTLHLYRGYCNGFLFVVRVCVKPA